MQDELARKDERIKDILYEKHVLSSSNNILANQVSELRRQILDKNETIQTLMTAQPALVSHHEAGATK
jgi:hypothetical protein